MFIMLCFFFSLKKLLNSIIFESMKILSALFFLTFILGCKTRKENSQSNFSPGIKNITSDTAENFFPVTTYIKGEIRELKNAGETLMKTRFAGSRTDTLWLKPNEFDSAFASFLTPVIDTSNLKGIFTETKFLDRTLNAFTFTYDPVQNIQESFAFRHWDVYVNPDNGKIKRIYLLKKINNDIFLQLTWLSNKFYKIVTIKNTSGKTEIIKEEKISRSYGDE